MQGLLPGTVNSRGLAAMQMQTRDASIEAVNAGDELSGSGLSPAPRYSTRALNLIEPSFCNNDLFNAKHYLAARPAS